MVATLGRDLLGVTATPNLDVELRGVAMAYGDTVVLHDVDLEVRKGEFLSLLGPSGCGKTTTLNIVAGFLTPLRGTVSLRGRVVNDVPPYRRHAGMVFQSYALFPHMNVHDNVAFGLKIRGEPATAVTRRVSEVLALVKLEGFAQRAVRQLSGGQQQRVAIARALAIDPLVLLMDEPLSNLDAQLRRQMRVELRRLQQQVGITTIFVTHDQEEALTLSDRLVVMNGGRIEQAGTPIELYRRPRTPFVAQFLGHPNFLFGEVAERIGGELLVRVGPDTIRARTDATLHRGAPVAVVLRPESASLSRERSAGAINALAGRVGYTVYLGTSAEYEVRLAHGPALRVVEQISTGIPSFHDGDDVVVSWAADDTMVFPGTPESFRGVVG
ncbi:MAG TPA: ABC transporter ATP-binding protein [Patescibacteria group bacterium]|nr:ABC transporter ATP-binding protein [Patescibacteria group bacterium]